MNVPGLNAPAEAATPAANRKVRKGALLTPAPPAHTPVAALLDWLTVNLRLPSPVERIERWGSSAVSPVVIKMKDGRKLRFAEAGDLTNPTRLVQTVVLSLGSAAPQLPMFTKPDSQDVFSVAIRACAIVEQDDDVDQARDWQDSLARIVRPLHHGAYQEPDARWSALRWLTAEPDFDAHAHRLAFQDARYGIPALVWADGSTFLRVNDVERYVRGVLDQRLASQQIVARMLEAGWTHRRAEARRPGAGRTRNPEDRVRVSVFEVRAAGEDDVSPTSPNFSHARTPAHARSTAWGSLGTHGETPINNGSDEPGDTKEAGDTADLATWGRAFVEGSAA